MAKRMIIAARRARGAHTVAGRSATRRPVQGQKGAKSSESAKRPTASRRAAKPTTPPSPKKPTLQFSWVIGSLKLVAPVNYQASMLFKEVVTGKGAAGYRRWLAVGRFRDEAPTVSFQYDDTFVIRCDVPEGMELSDKAIAKGLAAFLKADAATKKPIGTPGTGTGPGGTGPIGSNP